MHSLLLLLACGPIVPEPDETPPPPDDPENPLRALSVATLSVSTAVATLDLDRPTAVAVACARRDDPREVHLLEASGDGPLELRLAGLLPGTDYDCSAAPSDRTFAPRTASFRTPDPPGDLPRAQATANPDYEMTGAYTVMTVRPECYGRKNQIVVLDPDGANRWRYSLPPQTNLGVEVTPDGNGDFLWGGGKDVVGAPTRVSVFDGELWKLTFPGSDALEFHHDGKRIADGRLLSVADDWSDGWAAFQLHLSDDAGELSWSWDVRDAVDDGWLPAGSGANPDPHHLNWADVVETEDGPVAFGSLCFAYLVVAVDVTSGDPLWKFGYGGDFTLVDDAGAPLPDQSDFPQCQHGLSTDGRHLLVYDNGFDRGYTRAVEYELDPVRKTARRTWEFLDEGFYEPYHGNVDWLTSDHRRVLVAEANNACAADGGRPSQIVELDRTAGAEVHRLILEDVGHWIYRAHRIDGCALFANTRWCPALAARLDELRPALALP